MKITANLLTFACKLAVLFLYFSKQTNYFNIFLKSVSLLIAAAFFCVAVGLYFVLNLFGALVAILRIECCSDSYAYAHANTHSKRNAPQGRAYRQTD